MCWAHIILGFTSFLNGQESEIKLDLKINCILVAIIYVCVRERVSFQNGQESEISTRKPRFESVPLQIDQKNLHCTLVTIKFTY